MHGMDKQHLQMLLTKIFDINERLSGCMVSMPGVKTDDELIRLLDEALQKVDELEYLTLSRLLRRREMALPPESE